MDEPQALAADLFSQMIADLKTSRPVRTDGSSTQGFVYSQLGRGVGISPRDLGKPWSPIGGIAGLSTAPLPGTTPPPGTAPAPSVSEVATRAYQAAFNTAELCDTMLVVTDDGTYTTYSGGGRMLPVAYQSLLQAMEAVAPPPQPPEVKARVDAARAVLMDEDGNDSALYQRYQDHADDYADAVSGFIMEQARILADPALAGSAPQLLLGPQRKVKRAFDKWKADGAEKIEAALAVVESVGVPLEQGMIANARALLEAWSFPVPGVGLDKRPYTATLPSEWPLIEVNDIGWTHLTRTRSNYTRHFDSHGSKLNTGEWHGSASSSNVDAGISVFGFGFHGGHSSSSSSTGTDFSQTNDDGHTISANASNLSVDLEYGLARIVRPWLVPDLFRLRNWYLRGQKAGVISDGTIPNQVGKEQPLLPMLPTHLLVVRNVRITASDWGEVKTAFTSQWAHQHAAATSGSSSTSGGVKIPVWGPISLSGSASFTDSHYQGGFTDSGGNRHSEDYGAHFDGQTLVISGAQVLAVLGEIVPYSPPMDDPALAAAGQG